MRPSLRSTAPALLISAAVSGLLFLWAVSAAPASAGVSGAAAVLLTAAGTTAVHSLRTIRRLRVRNALLSARADRHSAESLRAADEVRRAQDEVRRAVTDAQQARAEATRHAKVRAAALSAGANAAGRMQALATSMLADLREMENRHTDEDVLGDLLHLDHRTAQAGRLADSIAVLTGARSGRRWAKPIVMESILRGALGRISGYQRVRLHSSSDVAIAGHAAEGVMHALAELLDNAANFSPPTAEVHVYVEEVPAGIVITVEDSGLVMSDIQLRRAERAVASDNADLSGVSGTRLGLAVVGRLARKHGLTVSFRPSARGGTGALLMLPQGVITQLRPEAAASTSTPGRTPVPAPARGSAPASLRTPAAPSAAGQSARQVTDLAVTHEAVDEPATGSPGLGESGLPQRRRGHTLAAARQRTAGAGPQPREEAGNAADATTLAIRFGSFHQAVRTAAPHPANPKHPEGEAP